ncbi:hypothetical protein GGS23DRAFT_343842 [Durotheca rogersii]|uniref:uncharacterized protein n=1 Tax=Durotheca rogersii TaxID=419775 RepID=UPI0022205E63|nr:uncharacterized protein GGS23DRAFT_343842 [Durotheca rogersii]KAI5857474.1 hypothetical protein GGS23DRAFT_343842 [Durotheca rogersii]
MSTPTTSAAAAAATAVVSPANLKANLKPQPAKLAITPISAASSPASALSPVSNVSTPTSAHPLIIKPATTLLQNTAMATAAIAKGSITSKEWVIPPRPKPGRKPATDTPPTKRKAQNRAAQRAFRERRAARVGELEEQLEEQKEEHDRSQQQLRDQVQGLESEVQTLRSRCVALEDLLEKERSERSRIANELDALRRRWNREGSRVSSRNGSFALHHGGGPSSLNGPQGSRGSVSNTASDHRNSNTAFSISRIISPPDSSDSPVASHESPADPAGCGNCEANGPCVCVDEVLAAPVGCGKCAVGTKCECIEAVLKGPSPNSDSDLKRKSSSIPALEPDEKRQKMPDPYPNEIDFTHVFSKKKPAVAEPVLYQPVAQATVPPRDGCGFCKEGTYCMCAETAAAQSLPPVSHQVQTPPPSENDVGPTPMEFTSTGAVKLPGINSLHRTSIPAVRSSAGCSPNGPGTCAQCLNDAKSGLFCRSLAATFAHDASGSGSGCCGGSEGSGCCKSTDGATTVSTPSLGLSVSCADAYKTLSSHRNFERAADDIGTWLPKLKAIPQLANTPTRLPIEVETASIMGVLKEFDVRFGRDA